MDGWMGLLCHSRDDVEHMSHIMNHGHPHPTGFALHYDMWRILISHPHAMSCGRYVANIGDSRCVLARQLENGDVQVRCQVM